VSLRKTFTVLWIQTSRNCINQNLPPTENISVSCVVIGRYHCTYFIKFVLRISVRYHTCKHSPLNRFWEALLILFWVLLWQLCQVHCLRIWPLIQWLWIVKCQEFVDRDHTCFIFPAFSWNRNCGNQQELQSGEHIAFWVSKLDSSEQKTEIPRLSVYLVYCYLFIVYLMMISAARGGAVGWGTVLQVGRLRVRFPMETTEPLTEMSTSAVSWG
jgi:hypothetical protein